MGDFQSRQAAGAGNAADAGDLGMGDDHHHPGCGARRFDVHRADQRIGVRGAHEDAVQQVGQAQVADIVADALDEARIFFALEALADPEAVGDRWTASAVRA